MSTTLFKSTHNGKTSTLKVPTYRIVIRKKYARKSRVFNVPSVTKDNFTRPDIVEALSYYEIAGEIFAKKDLSSYSCSIVE